jgi:hypothetical protein
MSSTITPNLGLTVPGVGTEAGPDYAIEINNDLNILDAHDHSLGSGARITPSGLNINTDLSLVSNSLTNIKSLVLTNQTAITTPMAIYAETIGGQQELFYNDGTGRVIQITENGIVKASIASLDGESYAGGTFTWTQTSATAIPANFDIGNIILRPNVDGTTEGINVNVPATGYSGLTVNLTLPLSPVTNPAFVTMDTVGVQTTSISTVQGITASNIANATITTTQISATAGILGSQLANHTITLTQLATSILQMNVDAFTIPTPSFAVTVATTTNGTMASSFDNGSVVDGITIATNQKILIKDQTVTTDNGVYVVQASGTPVRDTAYDTYAELNFAGVTVTSGTVNAGRSYFQNNYLTSLSDAQSWSRSSTQSFTVPANVNFIQMDILAAGGGGGSGGGGGTVISGLGGGGGGGGGTVKSINVAVTPGDIIAVTTGKGGDAGIHSASRGTGTAGGDGGDSYVYIVATRTTFKCTGGGGGHAGTGATGGSGTSAGGTAGVAIGFGGSGGAGGAGATGTAAVAGGASTFCYDVAAAGAIIGGGSPKPGGGGGTGAAVGGTGADCYSAGDTGGTPAVNSGAGGGGGGGTPTSSVVGTDGGAGADGIVTLYWLGTP